MDTTTVLAELLRQDLRDVTFFAIYDPEAVLQCNDAGVNADVSLMLGGRTTMPAISRQSVPLHLRGTVKTIADGKFRNLGPMGAGVERSMGPTLVFETQGIEIVIVSIHQEPDDVAIFNSLGIDPRIKTYVALKSRVHWRAGLGNIARNVIECSGLGVCTSDYSELAFEKVRRPIFPLDAFTDEPKWRSG